MAKQSKTYAPGTHWTQTEDGKLKLAEAQKKRWRKRRKTLKQAPAQASIISNPDVSAMIADLDDFALGFLAGYSLHKTRNR